MMLQCTGPESGDQEGQAVIGGVAQGKMVYSRPDNPDASQEEAADPGKEHGPGALPLVNQGEECRRDHQGLRWLETGLGEPDHQVGPEEEFFGIGYGHKGSRHQSEGAHPGRAGSRDSCHVRRGEGPGTKALGKRIPPRSRQKVYGGGQCHSQ